MIKAIFFDKDWTLVENNMYPLVPTDDILPFVIEWLKNIKHLGYKFFIVSNQSFINKWDVSIDEAESVFKTLLFKFRQNWIIFEDYVYCPHISSENCDCRKPWTVLVDALVKKYNIDVKNSFVIWDSDNDFKLALNLWSNFIAVNKKSTTDKPDFSDERIKYVFDDFRWIVEILKMNNH